MSEEPNFGYGQQQPNDSASDFAATCFLVRSLLAELSTMKLVKVVAVHAGEGDPPAAGTVDVLPLVNQIDGNGNPTEHGTVYGIPWFRLQAGSNAIIMDPQVDDVGFVVCADRDSSVVVRTKEQANPGSLRKYDVADGVYVGGILMPAPERYVEFTADSVKVCGGGGILLEVKDDGVHVTGDLIVSGAITATGEITRGLGGVDQVTLGRHLHTSGGSGSPTSVPTAGT